MDENLVKALVQASGKSEAEIKAWLSTKRPYEISAIRMSPILKRR